jgi:16S rRNA (uracil1498-N3)-methyltransferase
MPVGTVLTLDADDSHHALRVLRMKPGEECEVVVGAAVYAATVVGIAADPGKVADARKVADAGIVAGADNGVLVRLEGLLEGHAAGADYRFRVGLVQAIARPSALDWSIEKSTEAGASFILLLQTAGSPRWTGRDSATRLARWSRIAREAAKQSKQPAVPRVEHAPSCAAALDRLRAWDVISFLLDPEAERTLNDVLGTTDPTSAIAPGRGPRLCGRSGVAPWGRGGIALWVGPESGWTGEERGRLLDCGLIAVRLGRGVLRTETAGPVATAVARLALGDW